MFRNDPQRLSISVLISAVLETLSFLETAPLLRIFPLGSSPAVPGFGPAGGLLDGLLALVSLHLTPLTADELQDLFLASCANGFLCTLGRDPKATFTTVRATRVGGVFLALDFSQPYGTGCHEQSLEIRLQNGSVLWYAPARAPRTFHVKITRPNTESVGVVVHGLASSAGHGVFS